MPRLIISAPDGKKGILELHKPVVTIGRGNANDLVLNDAEISRFHAVVKLHAAKVVIADRGSTNGVIVNGERISDEVELKNGDVALLGRHQLRLEKMDERTLLVRKGEIPSTIDHILHGRAGRAAPIDSSMDSEGGLTEIRRRVEKLERENYLLTVLYDAGQTLHARLSVEDIGEHAIALAFRIEGVERGFAMLFDESGEIPKPSEFRYRDPHNAAHHSVILSGSILELMRKEQRPILIEDAGADQRFNSSESLKISGLRSAMCAPLLGGNRLCGILYVDNLEKAAAFTQDELNVFALLASQAGAAIDNVLAHRKIAQQAMQRSALERFLAPEVAEMVVANPDIRLGGVNTKAAIMFADIRGFTPMSENLAPDHVLEILNEYFSRVTDVIFDYGGMLDKYIGDAVMAVFGVPISKGSDAANCVNAAIHIQKLLVELNRDAPACRRPELRVGVGINTGIVTAGNIGSLRRIDYTVIGNTVNIASRLASNAAAGQILISDSTARELGEGFNLNALPPLMVKGRSTPVEVFDVTWKD
jgi:adenylate cyclase